MNRILRALCCAALLGLLQASCRALPEIAQGVCGNGVIDGAESCDGFGRGEASCRPPGTALACHLDCSERSDGTRPACPAGWGCAQDDVCRRASGEYRDTRERIGGDASSLITGDFDGDGHGDIVAVGHRDGIGTTKLRAHYFDREGRLARTWTSPRPLLSLVTARISDDARDDLVLVDTHVGLLLGQPDRTLLSATYPTYFLARGKVLLAGPLNNDAISNSTALLVFAERDGEVQLSHPDLAGESLISIARFEGTLDDLAGEPALGDVFAKDVKDPCRDLVVARRGASEFSVYSVCDRDSVTGAPIWADPPRITSVKLAPPAPISKGPLLADFDGDGQLDVMVASDSDLYVAFGDGARLDAAIPFAIAADRFSDFDGLPLAAGDVNGDGAADLIFADHFLLSHTPMGSSRAPIYRGLAGPVGATWTTAKIADLNGNGFPDVVAASSTSVDIDFFNGTASDVMKRFVIPSDHPVTQLAVGDLDGDLIADLVFARTGTATETDVSVAYGNPSGPPATRVIAARAPGVTQIGVLPHPDLDGSGEMFLAFEGQSEQGEPGSALAWFLGNGDRGLLCYINLTTFSSDLSLRSIPAVGVAAGSFTQGGQLDALLFGFDDAQWVPALWILPDLRSQHGQPLKLGWPLDPSFAPAVTTSPAPEAKPALQMAAGDLDGDGVEELVVAAPDVGTQHCLLSSVRLVDSSLTASPPLTLSPPCADQAQLTLVDLDGDSAAEALLLTGPAGGPRRLLLLWNDGHGGFSLDAMESLTGDDEQPLAFSAFRPTRGAPFALAYVTDTEVKVLTPAQGRGFAPGARALPLDLTHGTGVIASDIDGDGVTDLAVADDGSVRVLRAELER